MMPLVFECVFSEQKPRTVYVVVMDPVFVAGVVRWVDVDALDTVGMARK